MVCSTRFYATYQVLVLVLAAASVACACGGSSATLSDAGTEDAGRVDAGGARDAARDAADVDAGQIDASDADAGSTDAGGADAGSADAGPGPRSGLFPGTNLRFRPGFVVATYDDASLTEIEARWQAFFTSSPDRKTSYRPPGVYGGFSRRLRWRYFYVDENIRPADPTDPTDPAYDWSKLDDVFTINAVQNEGALVFIQVSATSYGVTSSTKVPNWLERPPYDGVFVSTNGSESRVLPKWYRYSGPDLRGRTDVGAAPPIVDEFVMFHRAMRSHLVSTGNIDKVMGVSSAGEFYGGGDSGHEQDYYHGAGTLSKELQEVWGASQIPVYISSISGGGRMTTILAQYVSASSLGIAWPDMKLGNTEAPPLRRFSLGGIYQKDLRPLLEATESNGVREFTTFASGVPNPWGYDGETVLQTASHVLWALSGPPTGVNRDSGLGRPGDDPPGIMPVHTVVLSWDMSRKPYEPTLDDWHTAIDTFGPPGTFAFPYLPPGYVP